MHKYIRLRIVIKGTSQLVNTKLHLGHGYTSTDVNAPQECNMVDLNCRNQLTSAIKTLVFLNLYG